MDTLNIAVQAVKLYAETHPRPPHVTQRQAACYYNPKAADIADRLNKSQAMQ